MKPACNPAKKDGQRVLLLRSNAVAPDPRVEKTIDALSANGYVVNALAWDRQQVAKQTEMRGTAHIERTPIAGSYGSGIRNLIPLLGWQVHQLIWLKANARRGDVLHACDFDTIFPARLVSTWRGCKLIYDVFDFYADNLAGMPGFVRKLIAWLERLMINRADGVILVDEIRLRQIAPAKPKKLAVIYNTPPDRFDPAGQKLPPQFTIVYIGQLLRNRGLECLIDVVGRHRDWRMVLAGFGADSRLLLSQAGRYRNIHTLGQIPYDEALVLMAGASVVLALYDPALENHRYASPNKLFEAMMLAKPVIAARDTSIDQFIEAHGTGLVVTYDDENQLEKSLNQLAEDRQFAIEMGLKARRYYEERYSWSKMEERLLSFYRDVIGER